MKVVILGLGRVGSVLARLLSREQEVKEIICIEKNHHLHIQQKKITTKHFDVLNSKKLSGFLQSEKPDVVVNAALPIFNLKIMRSCLKARVNYIDSASYWDFDKNKNARVPYKMEQLDLNDQFKKAGITGLINAGVSPGLTNLAAAECAEDIGLVESMKIRLLEDTGSKELFFPWNKDWLLDEINWKPLVYSNGKFLLKEPFSAEEDYEFPKPIGKRRVCYFAQDEVGSIPLNIKMRNLDVKAYDNNVEVSKTLIKLGLISEKEYRIGDCDITPLEFISKVIPDSPPGTEKRFRDSIFAFSVEAIGKKKSKFSVIFPKQSEIEKMNLEANFISYPTALSLKLFVMAMKDIKQKGVFPPEVIEKSVRKDIIKELKKSNLTVVR